MNQCIRKHGTSQVFSANSESFSRVPKGKVLWVYPIQVKNNSFFHDQKVGAQGAQGAQGTGELQSDRESEGDSHWTLIVPILSGRLTCSEREALAAWFSARLQVSESNGKFLLKDIKSSLI